MYISQSKMWYSINCLHFSLHAVPLEPYIWKVSKIDCLRFVICPLLVSVFEGFFLQWPLTELMKQTRQAVRTFKQSILLRCLWGQLWKGKQNENAEEKNWRKVQRCQTFLIMKIAKKHLVIVNRQVIVACLT